MSSTKTSPAATKNPFVYSDFEQAKSRLLAALSTGPFYGLVTGLSGSGKTSLLREVAASVDRHRFQVHYLAHSKGSASGVARFLAHALHMSPRCSRVETVRALGQTLRALPFRTLLFVDEAQLLSTETLHEIRVLAESELDCPPLFSVVFSALPSFKTTLEAAELFPLRRRLALRVELNGLKAHEVDAFLAHRLGGVLCARLPAESHSLLFERARGLPAFLETLARRCLEAAGDQEPLGIQTVTEVLEAWESD